MTNLLNTIISSEKRKNLLLLLKNEPQTWDQIKTSLNVTATGMLPQIRILEKEGLIFHQNKVYSLTCLGTLIVHYLKPFDATLSVIESQKQFWQEHDIGSLPYVFLIRIGELKDLKIIETSLEESFEPHNQFLDKIIKSRQVAGISPIVHPVYPKFFLSLAREGRKVRLILTKNAFNKIKREYFEMLLSGLQYDNAQLWIYDQDLRFAYIVTDTYFSMGLFFNNGVFDSKRDIVSTDPSAMGWGEDLFMYYMNRSHPVNKEGEY